MLSGGVSRRERLGGQDLEERRAAVGGLEGLPHVRAQLQEGAQAAGHLDEGRQALNLAGARIRLDGETVLAIGDVHGCHRQLAALLERFSTLTPATARLIFLGDMICRGPDSLAALALWAAPALDTSFAQVHRLSGNHEQLLMLSIGQDVAQSAFARWTTIDGMTFSRRAASLFEIPAGSEPFTFTIRFHLHHFPSPLFSPLS